MLIASATTQLSVTSVTCRAGRGRTARSAPASMASRSSGRCSRTAPSRCCRGVCVGTCVRLVRAVVEAAGRRRAADDQIARHLERALILTPLRLQVPAARDRVAGAAPMTWPEARFVSPSCVNALLRIASSRDRSGPAEADREVPGHVQLRAAPDVASSAPRRSSYTAWPSASAHSPAAALSRSFSNQPGASMTCRSVPQVAHRDDVRVPVGPLAPPGSTIRFVVAGLGVRVQLRVDQLPLPGGLVDHHDRRALVRGPAMSRRPTEPVGERLGVVEAGTCDDRRAARAEPVVAVVWRGADADALGVDRHRPLLAGRPAGRSRSTSCLGVNRLLGNGSRHGRPANGGQSAAGGSPPVARARTGVAVATDPTIINPLASPASRPQLVRFTRSSPPRNRRPPYYLERSKRVVSGRLPIGPGSAA